MKLQLFICLFFGFYLMGQNLSLCDLPNNHELNIGDVYLCPEIRYALTPYPFFQDNENMDSFQLIAEFIEKHPNHIFEIAVHTDYRGSDSSNLKFSENKAKKTYSALVEKFDTAPDRLSYKGYGESQPMIHPDTINKYKSDREKFEQMHQQNRRTTLRVIGIKQILPTFDTYTGQYSDEIDSLLNLRFNKTMLDSIFEEGDLVLCPEIRFQLAHWNVDSNFYDNIKFIALFLRTHPNTTFEIGVHIDTRAPKYRSTILSAKRAEAIKKLLVNDFGISERQITARGYEGDDPIVSDFRIFLFKNEDLNEYEMRHQVNRRTELKVITIH
jgi:outer membrane protein OmpA-like peptidoglycan-associated protein